MEKSRINPNHCRYCGIPVYDDTIDKYRELRLAIEDNLIIQMDMDGTTYGFDSYCTTLEDMGSCKRVTVSYEANRDP